MVSHPPLRRLVTRGRRSAARPLQHRDIIRITLQIHYNHLSDLLGFHPVRFMCLALCFRTPHSPSACPFHSRKNTNTQHPSTPIQKSASACFLAIYVPERQSHSGQRQPRKLAFTFTVQHPAPSSSSNYQTKPTRSYPSASRTPEANAGVSPDEAELIGRRRQPSNTNHGAPTGISFLADHKMLDMWSSNRDIPYGGPSMYRGRR